jgi:uncharacterized protein (DUF1697 family)
MHLFSVKSLYKWKVEGEKLFNFEERIVLFKAKNFETAIAKAEKEAKKHAKSSYTNINGKKVTLEGLEFFDAHAIEDDELKDGSELFTSSTIVMGKLSDKQLIAKAIDLDQKIAPKMREKIENSFRMEDHGHHHHDH